MSVILWWVIGRSTFSEILPFGLGSYLRLAVEQYKSLLAFRPVPHLLHSLMLFWKQMYFYLHLCNNPIETALTVCVGKMAQNRDQELLWSKHLPVKLPHNSLSSFNTKISGDSEKESALLMTNSM